MIPTTLARHREPNMTDLVERISEPWTLARGVGTQGESGCWMAYAAFATEGAWHDHPKCVCPVVADLCIKINDWLPDDRRAEVILPRLYDPIGTAQGREIMQRRAFHCADRAVRMFAPDALDAAGVPHSLRELPPVVDVESAKLAAEAAESAKSAAASVGASARGAAAAALAALAAKLVAQSPKLAAAVAGTTAAAGALAAPSAAVEWAAEHGLLLLLDDLLAIGADERQPVREVKSEAERFAAMGWCKA